MCARCDDFADTADAERGDDECDTEGHDFGESGWCRYCCTSNLDTEEQDDGGWDVDPELGGEG